MREAGAPSGRVLGRHGGQDLCGVGVGHRPRARALRLLDGRRGPRRRRRGIPVAARTSAADSVSSRLTSAASAGRVEVVHGGSWGGELDGVTALGGQVQVGPRDDILAVARRQSAQAESPQHPAEADLDADQFEPVVGGASEHHVGYPRESLAHNVDDLGVEHVAHEQDLVVTKRIGGRGDRECGRVIGAVYQNTSVLKALDRGPRHQ